MDAAALERVYEALQEFQAYFAPAFGRKQPRELSSHYLQALLVQSQERRNAENLARRFRRRQGRCSVFSPNRPGMMTG